MTFGIKGVDGFTNRSVDSGAIQAEPDVNHPFANGSATFQRDGVMLPNPDTYTDGKSPRPSHTKDSKKPKKHLQRNVGLDVSGGLLTFPFKECHLPGG
jgi:hypothetical protein